MIYIKKRREALGLTQTQIADRLGVAKMTVSAYEAGKNMPGAEKLPALAQILGCTIDELYHEPLDGEGKEESAC